MSQEPRKKSPRAPSLSLENAIEKVSKIYEKEGRHAIPIELAAKDLGYKDAKNGAALGVLASLKYFGLLIKPKAGYLAVSKDFEDYKYNPNDDSKRSILRNWLRNPQVFGDLLSRFVERLPSDAALKYELINLGFSDTAASECTSIFLQSVEYAKFYEDSNFGEISANDNAEQSDVPDELLVDDFEKKTNLRDANQFQKSPIFETDRIPIRLSGGRKAWLEIPVPFYEKDKEQIKAQVDLIFADEEEVEK
jgi:hypothetical protein